MILFSLMDVKRLLTIIIRCPCGGVTDGLNPDVKGLNIRVVQRGIAHHVPSCPICVFVWDWVIAVLISALHTEPHAQRTSLIRDFESDDDKKN